MRSSITITGAKDLKRHSIGEMDTTRVVHAENNQIVGVNFRGKTDAARTPLHDRIHESDGHSYVVASGNHKRCD